MKKTFAYGLLLAFAFGSMSCGSKSYESYIEGDDKDEPLYVTVQHVLITFAGSENTKSQRSREEAEALANDIYARAKSGEDFDELVEQYSDDGSPGVYQMANKKGKADRSRLIYARQDMMRAFADIGFALDVGEIALAPYDKDRSEFGWHIIRRLR